MLRPRDLAKRLRDLSRVEGPTLLSVEHGYPVPTGIGLYLLPDDQALEVEGRDFSAKHAGTILFECRNSRHIKRSGAGLSVVYALPLGVDHWILGVGTVIGRRHVERCPALLPHVKALWED